MSTDYTFGQYVRERVGEGAMLGTLLLATAALLITLRQFATGLYLAAQRPHFALMYTGGIVSHLAAHPEWLYHPLDTPPFLPTIYPPVYPLTLAGIQQVTGLPMPLLTRAVGLTAATLTAGIIGWLVYDETTHRVGAVVAGGLYLLSPAVSRSTVLARVDHLAMLVGVAAIAVVVWDHQDEHGLWITASGLTVLALFTKHSLVAIPLTIALIYAARRQWRTGALYVGATAVVGLSMLGYLVWLTDGRAWFHLVTLNAVQPYSIGRLAGQLTWLAWTHLALLAVALYAIGTHAGADLPHAWWALPVAGAAVAIPTLGKLGSWIGYAYPLIAGACLCVGWLVARHVPRDPRVWRGTVAPAVAVLALVVGAQLALYGAWAPNPGTDAAAQRQAAAHIADADGPVLSEDPRLDSEPFGLFVLSKAAERGVWADRVAPRIRAQAYAYLVLWQQAEGSAALDGRWNRAQIEAIRDQYRLAATYGKYRVYEPVEADHG